MSHTDLLKQMVLLRVIIIKIEVKRDSALIFVDFSLHSYKTHKQREKLYKSTVHELMSIHHDSETDILALDPSFVFKKIPFKRHGSGTDNQDDDDTPTR